MTAVSDSSHLLIGLSSRHFEILLVQSTSDDLPRNPGRGGEKLAITPLVSTAQPEVEYSRGSG